MLEQPRVLICLEKSHEETSNTDPSQDVLF